MGNAEILTEQLELGMPLKYAAVLAGYEKDEIANLQSDPALEKVITLAKANLIREHLLKLQKKSKHNSQDSKWLLEKVFPEDFSGKVLNDEGEEVFRVIMQRAEQDVL